METVGCCWGHMAKGVGCLDTARGHTAGLTAKGFVACQSHVCCTEACWTLPGDLSSFTMLYTFLLGLKSGVFDEPGNHACLLSHVLRFDLDPRMSVQCIHEASFCFFECDVKEKSERICQRHCRVLSIKTTVVSRT